MSTTVTSRRIREIHVVRVDTWGDLEVHLFQVRTLTFCLIVFASGGGEFYDWAKCHTKDRADVDIGQRKALGRALALTPLNRAQRLKVVDGIFPPF